MQKLASSKQYQELRRRLKPSSSSREGYERTQTTRSKATDLTNDADNLNKQLQEVKVNSELSNKEKIQALVDYKAGAFRWEGENEDLRRQVETAKEDLQSYDRSQPEAIRLSKLFSGARG